jgi:hypothetical protein
MLVSFSIMAHPARLGHVAIIQSRLRAQGAAYVPVAVDLDGDGPLRTARRAWNMRDPKSTHHVVLQDDITFCANFVEAVRWFADGAPVSFFLPNPPPWFRGSQAIMLPADLVRGFLSFDAEEVPPHVRHLDDVALRFFLRGRGLAVRAPVPTLVEHLGSGGSLLASSVAHSISYLGDSAVAERPSM